MRRFLLYSIFLINISALVLGQSTDTNTSSIIKAGFKPGYNPVDNKFSIGIQFNAQVYEYGGGIQFTTPDLWKNSGVKLRLTGNVMVYQLSNSLGRILVPYEDIRLGILKSFELYETLSVYTELGAVLTVNNSNNTTNVRINNTNGNYVTTQMFTNRFGFGGYIKCGLEVRPVPKYGVFFEVGGIITGSISKGGGIRSFNFAELSGGAPTFFANGYTISVGNRFYF